MALFDSDSQKNKARQAAKAQKKGSKKADKRLKQGQKKAVRASETHLATGRSDVTQAKSEALPTLEKAKTAANANLTEGRDRALGNLQGARDTSRADTTRLSDLARSDIQGAEGRGQGYLTGGVGRAQDYLNQGLTNQLGAYGNMRGVYQPLLDAANKGATAYGNFFGLGGQAGFDQAQSDWQNSPLYKAMVGTGSLGFQELNRQAGARGNPYNYADLAKYGDQLAQQYLSSDYIGGLRPYLDQQGQYAGDVANTYGLEANAYGNRATAGANLEDRLGQNQADLAMGAARNTADIATGEAGALTGIEQNYGNQSASANLDTGQGLSGNEMTTGALEGNAIMDTGKTLGGYEQNVGNVESGVYSGTGTQMANNANTAGQAQADMYGNLAAADSQAQQNQWNAIMGAAGLGTNLLTAGKNPLINRAPSAIGSIFS